MVLLSCNDGEPYMTIENSDYTFEAIGGEQAVAFVTNVDWTAKASQDWCTVSPVSGGELAKEMSIAVAVNNTYDDRRCSVTITTCCFVKTVTITQMGKR